MKKLLFFSLGFVFLISQGAWGVFAGHATAPKRRVTLYSPNKYQGGRRRAYFFSFKRGAVVRSDESGDVGYGALYVGEYFDWFETSGGRDNRSVIRDLGAHAWGDSLNVPVVEPLPKLKEGETRQFSVDASGANGAPGRAGVSADDVPVSMGVLPPSPPPPPPTPRREPVVDSHWVKAVVGHMYVIHAVDAESDYYALFRVEALQRGDNCTITWRVVPAPAARPHRKKR